MIERSINYLQSGDTGQLRENTVINSDETPQTHMGMAQDLGFPLKNQKSIFSEVWD